MTDSVSSKLPQGPNRRRMHDPDNDLSDMVDTSYRAGLSELTGGLSPNALAQLYFNWMTHLSTLPGKRSELTQHAAHNMIDFGQYLARCALDVPAEGCVHPDARDRRFRYEGWEKFPFNVYKQGFLLTQQWWDEATTNVRGVTKANERAINFTARQFLDAMSPANFPLTNPEVLDKVRETKGHNFAEGAKNFQEDIRRYFFHEKPAVTEEFRVGRELAATPGKVVFRNHLIELIQYDAVTEKVHPEPILITPAWIMKYYILDLSPENSMVKYLTEQGFTVFMISWRNPGVEDADLGMNDYREQGPMAALDQVLEITSAEKVHGVGYCLGGTLLSIAAAAMARDGDDRLASLTLFAAQSDFTEAGELMLFISEAEVAFLEDMMWKNGYLDAAQMAGAFQLLRSSDLIWSRMQHEYLMGERPHCNDLMAWNADTTRMPYRMHSEYLRYLFLNNAFAAGHFEVGGRSVTPTDLRIPIFAVGTETDHVAPWKSVFKIDTLSRSEVTFVLTNGGHNAGVISEPGHPRRHFRVHTNPDSAPNVAPDEWLELAEMKRGSWWPEWSTWLSERSRTQCAPPKSGKSICDAPGTYVMME